MVQRNYVCSDGYAFGAWLANQRNSRNNPTKYHFLTDEQIKLLESIVMIWSVPEYKWQLAYGYAREYYEENGNLFVTLRYKMADGYSLGDWIRQQVEKYHGGTMDKEKIQLLEKIGKDWLFSNEREW